ncbi:Nif11-like leader peptide family natural product precursor [Synechococcus sp. UW105]|uniref:Nif11-like leader peptide family natural product precursor n=1 Tax=Synechococcus sp. UW105 TaxID=337067 RepID=UPI000E0F6F87|nr:Nif11-like leader peptide family natural product precursor [Synechococcus sp. UW105]
MSEEQLKAFLKKVKGDSSLQEKLKAATNSETVAIVAKEAGFRISSDDLNHPIITELSEAELEVITGSKGCDQTGNTCRTRDTADASCEFA